MKGEISYRHPAVNMLFVVKLDSMWELTSFWSRWPFKELQFCTFFFFFFVLGDRGFCSLRRKAEMLKK